ncbi:major facilitator superfamily transporter [Biscogniauxia mediterranea]|nr:major facilitator superfamily transporter [Biscogniauxia mediterranea]
MTLGTMNTGGQISPSSSSVSAPVPDETRPPPPTTATNTTGDDGGGDWKPTKRFLLAFASLQVLIAAVAIESTSLAPTLPIMSAELGGTALQAFWAGTGYLLASTLIQPSVASMSHTLGRRIMLYISGAGFAGGSLIAALARNFTVVLVGRIIQGIGGGGLVVVIEILISDLIPLAHRGTWFSINSIMWSIGTAGGPLIGAGFAQNVSWRWIFWINLPIVGLGMVFVTLFLNQEPVPGHIVEKLLWFDWLGSVLFSISSASVLFGITTGGVVFEWGSYQVLIPVTVGLAGIVCFFYWEIRFASNPIIEKRIFSTWTANAAYAQTLLHGLVTWAAFYFLVLYYQGVKSYSPIFSAVALLPETINMAWASIIIGVIANKTMKYRWALWGGWSLVTLGAGLLYLLEPGTSVVQWVFLNVPFGIGIGSLFTAEILAIQASTAPMFNGHAAAFFSFIRIFGQAIGVAVSGVIFQNVFKQQLGRLPGFASVADEYSRDATIVVEVIRDMPEGTPKRQIIQAFSSSLQAVWLSLLAFSTVGLILSTTVKGYSMKQEHVTEQKLVEGEKSAVGILESGVMGSDRVETR